MEHTYAWLLAIFAAIKWLLAATLLAAAAIWIWKKRLWRCLLLNGGHGLATVSVALLFVAVLSSVGPSDGFGAWRLVPLVLGTPPVALALIIWGLVARSRSSVPVDRRLALTFSALALIPLIMVVSIVFGSG